MNWIKIINYEDAGSRLKKIYDRIKGPNNNVDNVLLIHSLRPHTLVGHMTLYKNVLHNSNNTLPKWYLEALGVYVSHLNKCDYCFEHHYAGFKRLYADDAAGSTGRGFVKTLRVLQTKTVVLNHCQAEHPTFDILGLPFRKRSLSRKNNTL